MASLRALNQVLGLQIQLVLVLTYFALWVNGDDLIVTTCNHTLHFEVCVSSLRSDPRSETSDLKGLADMALNLSITYGAKTLSYVHELRASANDTNTNSNTRYLFICLNDCFEEYSEAVQNLEESAQSLFNKDYDKLSVLVTAAMTDSETCEEGFIDNPNDGDNRSSSPLSDHNQYFSELCSNFLAISKLLLL